MPASAPWPAPPLGPPRRRPRRRRNAPAVRGRPRCPSLVELATEAVVANIDMCVMASHEVWGTLPPRSLVDIYERLSAQNRLSLDAWSLLSTTLFAHGFPAKRSIYHHTARILPPSPFDLQDPTSFTLRLGPAWSTDSFITHLTLESTCQLETSHLLLLPSMRTLGLLRIVEPRDSLLPRPRVTDRLIRGWAEQRDPFPALRILQLSCCLEVTSECLRYLAAFPALAYVAVRGRKKYWDWNVAYDTAPRHGWRVPEFPDDVQALMRRYFASCVGIRDGLAEQLECAAALVSEARPTVLAGLFGDTSTVGFGKRSAVLPWEGSVPSGVSDTADAEGIPLGGEVSVYDNPMWWLYTAIGHVILRDGDLASTEAVGEEVPTSDRWVLPPLPVLSLAMGSREPAAASLDTNPRRDANGSSRSAIGPQEHRLAKYVFVRKAAFAGVAGREAAWVPEKAPAPSDSWGEGEGPRPAREGADEVPLRQRKRRRMGDVLSSMARG